MAPSLANEAETHFALLVVRQSEEGYEVRLSASLLAEQEGSESLRRAAKIVAEEGGFEALVEQWKPLGPVGYATHFELPVEAWHCLAYPDPNTGSGRVALLGTPSVSGISFEFESGASGLMEVNVSTPKETHYVSAFSRAPLEIYDSVWLPHANGIRDMIVETLFQGTQ